MVLLLAWETWCPTWGFLPVTWQTRAMRCSAGKGAHYRSKPGGRSSSASRRRIRRGSSQQPALGKGHRAAPCDDEMVEHLNIDQGERTFQRAREDLVGMARLCDTGGVVVRENHGRRVMPQGALDHLARVNTRLGQGTAEQFLVRDDAMLRVQEQHHEDFLLTPGEREAQVVAHCSRRRQRTSRRDFLLERAARQLEDRLELRELGGPQTRSLRKVRGLGFEQPGNRAEAPEQLACEVNRALSLDAGTKQNREQLRVGKRGGAQSKQAFAWTLLNGPVCYRHRIRLKSRFAA